MSFQLRRRFIVMALMLVLGFAASEVVRFWWFAAADFALQNLISLVFLLLAAILGIRLDARINPAASVPPKVQQVNEGLDNPQADNRQEISRIKQAYQEELSRLSAELAAQKEKISQAEFLVQSNDQRFRNIDQQIQAYQNLEQAVEDRTRELSTVLDVSKKIATTLELEPLLNLILDQIETILPYSGAAIFTLDGDLLEVAACHVPSLSLPKRVITLSLDHLGQYLPVIQDKKVMILDDVHGASPLALAFLNSFPQSGFTELEHARSWIGIPLVIWDRVMGLLSLTHNVPGYYTQNHARLAQSITYQVAIAIENARLYEKAQNLATLEERNRIARELHDSVTQLLYGITLYCTATTRTLQSENFKQVEQNLAEIKENALQALREMRLLILELNPPLLQKEGLVKALTASLETIESRTGLETELKTDGVYKLPRTLEPDLYRIAMEALNNLVRYAKAQKVSSRSAVVQ